MSDHPSHESDVPLCVDLDDTFIRSDLLIESTFRLLRHRPLEAWRIPLWLAKGKAHLKGQLGRAVSPPATPPPVNTELAEWLHSEKKRGRRVLLVTASHREAIHAIPSLFPFDEVITSDDTVNLKGEAKAEYLEKRFGHRGFDYAGDSDADRSVWDRARKAILVMHSRRKMEALGREYEVEKTFCTNQTSWRDWIKALRIHQWAKNLLIALPFLAGHHFTTAWELAGLFAAFLAMSLCASGTYLWNDLLDLEYDRAHPSKSKRLAASGKTSLQRIIVASVAMVGAGLVGGFVLSPEFGLLLICYIIATLSYSLYFKRVAIADIFFLTFLYLSRIIGGIIISAAVVSFWLFAFTFLLFLSLAAAKRFVELKQAATKGTSSLSGRGYRPDDLPVIGGFGMATGVASCIVLALYSHSPKVAKLYDRPEWLWGLCVIALFWITRVWFMTYRGEMHDDPVVFALKDRGTWALGALGVICSLLASPLIS